MNPIDLFYSSSPLSLSEFGALFSECNKAFRFEALYQYIVEEEKDFIKLFIQGQPKPDDFNREWLDVLDAAKERSASFVRVRKAPDSTISTYMSFEYEWGYKESMEKGEEIRIISASVLSSLKSIFVELDFWLFDDKTCCLLHYDEAGRFLGVSKTSKEGSLAFIEIKTALMSNSNLLKF